MRILVIGNPIAGGGRARGRMIRLVECLQRDGHDVETFLTGKAGDAAARVARLESGLDRLVVAGGDGSLNEVLNGLTPPDRIPIALLPCGTANLIGHDLGLPRDPAKLARVVTSGAIRRVDTAMAGERRFVAVLSAGFDAMVTREIQRTRNGSLGYLAYLAPALRSLRSYRPPQIAVRVDDGAPVAGQFVIVSNTRNYGGIFTIADRARCDSGHLDVCVFPNGSVAGLVAAAVRGLTGGVSRSSAVRYLTGRRIEIASSDPVPMQIDGDYAGTTPVSVEIRESSARLVVA